MQINWQACDIHKSGKLHGDQIKCLTFLLFISKTNTALIIRMFIPFDLHLLNEEK